MKDDVRYLPAIHELQNHKNFREIETNYGIREDEVTRILRGIIDKIRKQILENNWEESMHTKQEFIEYIFRMLNSHVKDATDLYLKTTINGTGTVLHTNLGRARLSEDAVRHVNKVAQGYSNLEYDLAKGERGSRHSILEETIKRLTGAEAAMVVNNNAAAVFLILRGLAENKEVVVSRGQLVEIGGSFRVSEIMEESGARLVEVGTTNKTHLWDYEQAISEHTSMILKVHTSNFKTIGFTKTVEISELLSLRKYKEDIIIYEDLGSGVLYKFKEHGIGDEPTVKQVLDQGVDIVSFSGDKLLGGPQAGIIAGKKELISRLKKHQLARVLRVDKMTYAALESTLLSYLGDNVYEIPTIRDILLSKEEIYERCSRFKNDLHEITTNFDSSIMEDASTIGGGTMPGVEIPTYVVVLTHKTKSAEEISKQLRTYSTPVIARVKNEKVLLDFRTITISEIKVVVEAFKAIDID
ncbi:L-seryl-tRNA(Sec) selenium transferase [Fredinandcohnia sp. 179-A 10B2 NHS]|uniref:L-seryl-tRNA(Sec) selenium transferase n=1 Tax=Fredinandcohnia sp. 179-A 10B2 NHS TaxID=3235176 RepID=UPI00399FF266